MSDPYFSNVVLLCHCDGVDGSTTFTDVSNSAHPLTATGVTVTTSSPKFGSGSAHFSSASSSIAVTSNLSDFAFGSGPFTVEAWGLLTSFSSTAQYGVLGDYQGAAGLGWDFGLYTGVLSFTYSTTGTNNIGVGASYTPPLNTWIHLAADRDASGVLRVYANGVVIASAAAASAFFTSTNALDVGNDLNAFRGFPGNIDEVRVTKGVARYAGAFTPPAAAFPDAVPIPTRQPVVFVAT